MRPFRHVLAELRAEWQAMSLAEKINEVIEFTVYAAFAYIVLTMVYGCSVIEEHTGARPYFEVGVGYQLDSSSDYWRRTDREFECSQNGQAHFETGLDFGDTRIGYHHQSWWVCGGPFWDDRKETYSDDIRITHTFGGK